MVHFKIPVLNGLV